jgi:nucleotide-binding universal stress UspA family protein
MRKILVAVDGADAARTQAAVAEAVRIYAQAPVDVHLLSVQPPVSGHVAMFFDNRELHELQQAAGAEDLARAEALLRASNVPCSSSSVRVGRCAETIARTARELGCDRIVLGREGVGAGLASKLFGSMAQQVRQVLGGGDCQVIGA